MNAARLAITGVGILAATSMNPTSGEPIATLIWQVDAGNGWQSGTINTSATTMTARLLASWNEPAVFELSIFDATIVSPAGAVDQVSNFAQQYPLNFTGQGFASTRFGSLIKIDRAGDSSLPGIGSQWIDPYQDRTLPERLLVNPIELFRYTITFDQSVSGARTLGQVHLPLPNRTNGNATNVVSLDISGQIRAVPTIRQDAVINYIPTPGSLAATAGIIGIASRRRR